MGAPAVQLRMPTGDDWGAIGALADVAVAHVPGARPQHEWTAARRGFEGERRHVVAERDGGVVGYGALERRDGDPEGWQRLFVVLSWTATPEIADLLYDHLVAELDDSGVRALWMRELDGDEPLLAFARRRGFEVSRRYEHAGLSIVSLTKPLGE